jgi:hypothetical protein
MSSRPRASVRFHADRLNSFVDAPAGWALVNGVHAYRTNGSI